MKTKQESAGNGIKETLKSLSPNTRKVLKLGMEVIKYKVRQMMIAPRIRQEADNYVGHPQEVDEDLTVYCKREAFKDGAVWLQSNAWVDAQGDNLPEIDREVIVLVKALPKAESSLKVAFGHRPDPKGWDGKDIITGKVTHRTPVTYDKGGWNQPNVKYWHDVELPNEMETEL